MVSRTFSLRDTLISYSDDRRAARLPRSRDGHERMQDGCTLGVVAFHDDRSVHADCWECHPAGDEVLCVLEGRLLVTPDRGGATEDAVIGQGQAFIVPRRTWHRLLVLEPGRLPFLTPRAGARRRRHETGAAGRSNPADT